MLKKMVNAFIINLICLGALSAELHWWRPREITELTGYTDSYAVAMNRNGKAIALFDDKILGSYDLSKNRWEFCQIGYDERDQPVLHHYSGSSGYEFSIGKPSKGNVIALNDNNEGWVVFIVSKGSHKGKIGVVQYSAAGWHEPLLLSQEPAGEPTMSQGYDGRVLVVWVNRGENKKDSGKLMSAYYEGSKWIQHGVISKHTSIDMDYNQIGPQLAMNDLGDGAVVWKVQEGKKGSSEEALLVAHYFDGVEEKWCGEDIIGKQSIEKKGRDLKMNFQGEVLLAWDTEQGIEVSMMNLMKYMIYQSGWVDSLSKEKDEVSGSSPWVNHLLAEGEEVNMPKICMNRQGNAVVVWLEGYSGMHSACFDSKLKSWNLIEEPVTSQPAYASALHIDGHDQGRLIWIGEGPALSEIICSRAFDFPTKTWTPVRVLNHANDNSLIDAVDGCSLAKTDCGILIWYDFFKNKLFYSILKEGNEPGLNMRREGILYKKKQALSERRFQRRGSM